ncbi:MAG TPA: hypothetical protein PLR25_09670, partial [Planctomycetaceae bacterium]|nr:hypothetical protein [Planctomycetaceae bacterium]
PLGLKTGRQVRLIGHLFIERSVVGSFVFRFRGYRFQTLGEFRESVGKFSCDLGGFLRWVE